jgi:hypothetical protein
VPLRSSSTKELTVGDKTGAAVATRQFALGVLALSTNAAPIDTVIMMVAIIRNCLMRANQRPERTVIIGYLANNVSVLSFTGEYIEIQHVFAATATTATTSP